MIPKKWLSGKTFAVRGEKRYALVVWQFAAVGFLGIGLFTVYRDGEVMKELAATQYIVYEVDRRGNVMMHSANDYQLGPLQVEIEGRAIDVVRWIVKADSNDVDTARAEAARTMTADMQQEFEAKRGLEWAEKIKKLNIYRIIDEINARPLKAEDLPAETRNKIRITKYDTVVYGKVQTYRRGTGEWLDEAYFAMHVTQQPQEARTKENTSALKVDFMSDLDPQQVMGGKKLQSTEKDAEPQTDKSAVKNEKGEAQAKTTVKTPDDQR